MAQGQIRSYVLTRKHFHVACVPTVDLGEDLLHPCLPVCNLQVPLDPGYEMILECAFNQLVQDVG